MKKKLFPILVGLLTVTALTACSTNKSKEGDSSSSSTVASSKVEESTSASSSSVAKTLKESTVAYPSDQEIEAIQTLGDVKGTFKSLSDTYVADFDELVNQLPEEGKKALAPFREQLAQMLEKQQEALATQFETLGDDNTQIPEEGRESMISILKTSRDQLKQAMTTAREQAQAMLQ